MIRNVTNDDRTAWMCSHCGLPHDGGAGIPCPACGRVGRTANVNIVGEARVVVTLAGKVRDPTLNAKKNPRVKFELGQEINHKTGELVAKDRRVDRRLDRYWEKIRDARGRFVMWVDHKLSRHRGHGSAKRK